MLFFNRYFSFSLLIYLLKIRIESNSYMVENWFQINKTYLLSGYAIHLLIRNNSSHSVFNSAGTPISIVYMIPTRLYYGMIIYFFSVGSFIDILFFILSISRYLFNYDFF